MGAVYEMRAVKNGAVVREFEQAFAEYVGARYCLALVNGTATLHTALAALGIGPGHRVAVPPLTMSSTTLAVLHAGATPVFVDVDPQTWLMSADGTAAHAFMPVSLYGLSAPYAAITRQQKADHRTKHHVEDDGAIVSSVIDDAAQTLRKHSGAAFTSYSTQFSKILSTGEGGLLVTNDETLAERAREFSSLGYRMRADQPRIDPAALKSPTFDRHNSIGWNYRMNDLTAAEGLRKLAIADDELIPTRHMAAMKYEEAIDGCEWITQQAWPEGWEHDMWTKAVACDTTERAIRLADAVVKHGGERPYPAWKLTYDEPAFSGSAASQQRGEYSLTRSYCPVAESLQPRILQMQTNSLASAERNALALRRAIEEID